MSTRQAHQSRFRISKTSPGTTREVGSQAGRQGHKNDATCRDSSPPVFDTEPIPLRNIMLEPKVCTTDSNPRTPPSKTLLKSGCKSSPTSVGPRRSSKASSEKSATTGRSESGVLPAMSGVKIAVRGRPKLPWLDGARQTVPVRPPRPMPGSFEEPTEDQPGAGAQRSQEQPTQHNTLPAGAGLQSCTSPPSQASSSNYEQSSSASRDWSPTDSVEPILVQDSACKTPIVTNSKGGPAATAAVHWSSQESTGARSDTEVDPMQRTRPVSAPLSRLVIPDDAEGSATQKSILKQASAREKQQLNEARREIPFAGEGVNPLVRMDNLMEQAEYLAQDAAQRGNLDEVSAVLQGARAAVRHIDDIYDSQCMSVQGRTSGSDHTSTYSPFSSSDEWEPQTRQPYSRSSVYNRDRRRSAPAIQAGVSEGVGAKDWAYVAGIPPKRSLDFRKRRKTLADAAFRWPSAQDTADAESHHSLLDYAKPMETATSARKQTKQPLGYEGTASPFEDSPTAAAPEAVSAGSEASPLPAGWGRDKLDEKDYVGSDALKGQRHVTLKEGQKWSIHHHRRQPIARNWSTCRKRLTATVACINTALIGLLVGIYAGEVPAIQYRLTDLHHHVNLGNVALYFAMMVSSFLFWPLPLLHGRKPYTVTALAVALPMNFPQALMVMDTRDPSAVRYRVGLLLPRAILGFALGFVHINVFTTLLDLFGASLQSEYPHGEVVILDDVRRHGGGLGLWLGGWSFCFLGSLAVGFFLGAEIISGVDVSWGFYICVIIVGLVLLLNVVTPETRRSPHRRTMQEVQLANMNVERRVGRGEVKIHVTGEGPMNWREEVTAGIRLSMRMFDQIGFFLMASYLGWVYAQVWLIIVLLGNLLSTEYRWRPEYIGAGVLSMAVGAALAIPLSRANLFSRSRDHGPRTDSMTLQPRLTWTSHLLRRTAFMTLLPLAGMAYTLGSAGQRVNYMVPIVFAGLVGFVSNLAVAECHGIIMEAFDTSDLQPGVNSRHRLQSLAVAEKRRRTTYSSYPRVTAGLAVAHALGFGLAGAATAVSGALTRAVGAQKATGIVAGVLAVFTVLLTLALVRYKSTQVIPNELFGSGFGSSNTDQGRRGSATSTRSWRAVIIGNPSGRHRRLSLLELGGLSRWTEIRRLNRLLDRTTTQGLQPGWR